MESLEKAIKDFFSHLQDFSFDWISKAKKSSTVLLVVRNQFDQLQTLERIGWCPVLIRLFPDIQVKLRRAIFYGLDEETSKLADISKELLSIKKTLKSKLDTIERNAYKINLASHTSFGELAPPVYKFIELSEDIMRHYTALYVDIEYALACLDYEDRRSIDCLENAFQKSMTIGRNVTDIIYLWKALQDV